MAKVAISCEFLEAFSKIPKSKQKKVREFINRFQANPYSNSINYEKITHVADDRVRTARIDLSYRAVLLHPDQGDVFILAWVDHHDEAMDWAKRKTFDINPVTGALQVYDHVEIEKVKEKLSNGDKPIGEYALFETFPDEDLLRTGLPEVLLPAVKAIKKPEELDKLQNYLPDEAYEALFWISNLGYSIDQAIAEVSISVPEVVDTEDLGTALDHPDSKRRFAVVKSVDEMVKMLNAPLEKWRVFLHPSQSNLVSKNYNGPARILGGAGTGKTVVAMHRAQYLAKNFSLKDNERILFTTFTKNLAKNIQQNLRQICGKEYQKIEVVHLHSWASQFLRSRGIKLKTAHQGEINDCWRDTFGAISSGKWDEPFIRSEWENVVQANGIRNKNEYLRVSRIGRGKRLPRSERTMIWEIFEEYIHNLEALGKIEWIDLIRETKKHLESISYAFPYKAVIVDETQDLHAEELKLIRTIIPKGENDIFLVGDAHQRIYGQPVVMSRCGIDIVGRSKKLKINYRTTEEIKKFASSILMNVPIDDMDGGFDDDGMYKSLLHGPEPKINHFRTMNEEIKFIFTELENLQEIVELNTICLVGRTKDLISDYIKELRDLDINFINLEDDQEDKDGLKYGTMHRVKGLEFHHIFIVGVNDGVIPLEFNNIDLMDENYEVRERCLLHVATTRARDSVTITSHGTKSRFLDKLGSD